MANSPHSENEQAPNRKALIFIIITAFLSSMGIGLIIPIAPYLVSQYITDPGSAGMAIGWLSAIYAICEFISAPAMGVLSDRFGRRPILIISLLGSAVGYLLMGVGGAFWMLLLSRVVDGLTGGNITVAFAYIADITPPGQRGKLFGYLGAVAGIGFILGPAIGGVLATAGYQTPLLLAAAVTFLNTLYGLFFMPESLKTENRSTKINVAQLNPFGVLRQVLAMPQIRWLLIAIFLYTLPFAALGSNIGLLAKDTLNWGPATTGSLFVLVGLSDIVVQGLLLQRLLNHFSEAQVAIGGMCLEIVGAVLIGVVVATHSVPLMYLGCLIYAMGDGLLGPAINGMLSRATDARNQGQVQGGSQSVQSIARIGGPLLGGEMYDLAGHASPYLGGIVLVVLAIGAIMLTVPTLADKTAPASAS